MGRGIAKAEVGASTARRLGVAGYCRDALFSDGAVSALHRASRGVPRLVNILAHKSLLLVFGQGARRVERSHISAAVGDTPAAARLGRAWWPRFRFTRVAD